MTDPPAPAATGPARLSLPWILLLRVALATDAVVLMALGLAFVLFPGTVERAFQFGDLPRGGRYLIGLWGCGLATMSIGYAAAALNPLRHLIWVRIGIGRGILEVAVGIYYVALGVVTWNQAGFGIVVAALLTLAYSALYPRKRRDIRRVDAGA